MKKYLNTLYVMTEGAYIHKERETVVVEVEKKKKLQLPIHTIANIFCFGNIMVSPSFMGFCGKTGIGLAFFSMYGRFLARVQGRQSGNVLLRREQYRFADSEEKSSAISSLIIGAKISSSRAVLLRALRNNPNLPAKENIKSTIDKMKKILGSTATVTSLELIRGLEGEAAKLYFAVFDHLILQNKEIFKFKTRNKRPPLDRVNAMLSFIYTLIAQDCVSACEGVGLDPGVGFLHRDRPGRPGLALDIMEEFRSWFGDRLVLSMINLKQVGNKGFTVSESGAVLMDEDTRKTVITAYQKRKQEMILHPFLNEKVEIGLCFHLQAKLMSRFIRGDMDFYPPFLWK